MENNINTYDVDTLNNIKEEAILAAKQAVENYLTKWNKMTGGNSYGEPIYCGFAYTKIYNIKGNTKLGRAMKAAGFKKDHTGNYLIWNPADYHGQSMDVKEAGADAFSEVFTKYGFDAHTNVRAD